MGDTGYRNWTDVTGIQGLCMDSSLKTKGGVYLLAVFTNLAIRAMIT